MGKISKICTKCKENKSLDLFYNCKKSNDGKRSQCKACRHARILPGGPGYEKHLQACKKNRDKNKENKKLYNKAYYFSLYVKKRMWKEDNRKKGAK